MVMFKTVAVGVSGGVDSAAAALLLKNRGFNVLGVFMKNWDEEDETGECSVSNDRRDAMHVCNVLKIPFHEVSFVKRYWTDVFSNFLREYQDGFTPNPDILCNRFIKFQAFVQYGINEMGADCIATGHYAQSSYGNYLECVDDSLPVRLLQARDKFKDQTFFLSQVQQHALRRVMFPLGSWLKSDVKNLAAINNLNRLSKKRESTGICFIGKRNFQDFISDYIAPNAGPLIDISTGNMVKKHSGLHLWTIGQCCRLTGFTQKYFIARKKQDENIIYVCPGTNHPSLFTKFLVTSLPNFINPSSFKSFIRHCYFRFQHTKPLVPCVIVFLPSRLLIVLERPLKAITPGQYAVFYDETECLGSAKILHPGPSLYSLNHSVPSDYEEYDHFREDCS